MQLCSFFPFPPEGRLYMSYANINMFFVESIAELIKASKPIHKQRAGTIWWRMTNDKFRWKLK